MELRQSEVRILQSMERRLSHALDYLVCQSMSKNLARLPTRSFSVNLMLACLWCCVECSHALSNGKSFRLTIPTAC